MSGGRSSQRPRRVLVLGGARSGKSHTAEQMLADEPAVEYIATGPVPSADDQEWLERVRLHRVRRPPNWHTLQTRDLEPILTAPAGPAVPAVLIDCVSTWLSGVMDDCGLWQQAPGSRGADVAVAARIEGLLAAWARSGRLVVAVSNEVGSGVVPETVSGRRYRDELGRLNARLAAEADEVWLITAGIGQRLK
jgi:adenosylcobinamide kinase/adenosylcobinamide-phosphate guanylyltransferase